MSTTPQQPPTVGKIEQLTHTPAPAKPQPTTAVAVKPQITALQALNGALKAEEAVIKSLLPDHANVERVIASVMVAAQKNPDLQKCTRLSVLNSVKDAAQLGLMPCGPLQHGYLIPYKDQCTFQPSYRGLIELARRSGQLLSISARLVYENDSFDYSFTNGKPNVFHKPAMSDAGKLKSVYAFAELRGNGQEFELMSMEEVGKIRARSQAKSGPWDTDEGEMAKKTVLKRLLKRCPMSPELATAIEMDDQQFKAAAPDMATATAQKATELRERLAATKTEPVAEGEFEMVEGQV